jgi:HrpA-like RNA helicase
MLRAVFTLLPVDTVNSTTTLKGGGAVLVFMPGLQEIAELIGVLHGALASSGNFLILPLHSELSTAEQQLVFAAPYGALPP